MAHLNLVVTQPASPALRWLIHPGRPVSRQVAATLLAELFASPLAVLAAAVNGLVLNLAALFMHAGTVFAAFIVADAVLVSARLLAAKRVRTNSALGRRTPTGLYFVICMGWCAVQGAMGFAAMRSGIAPLQVICSMTIVGLVGPICFRNYGAPRYALTLVALCLVPLVMGAVLSGNPWLWAFVLQTPAFLFSATRVLGRLQGLTIATLEAEQDSHERSRRDALTGLANRFGLTEALEQRSSTLPGRFTFFYLDLDGFKQINDEHGHQAGDQVLRAVAKRLGSVVRDGDIVARLGGDEFVIVATDISPGDSERYARQVVRCVADEPYLIDGTLRLRTGISVGFACSPEDGVAGDDLHRKADAALYQAKAAGKGVHRRFQATDALSDLVSAALADPHPRWLTAESAADAAPPRSDSALAGQPDMAVDPA